MLRVFCYLLVVTPQCDLNYTEHLSDALNDTDHHSGNLKLKLLSSALTLQALFLAGTLAQHLRSHFAYSAVFVECHAGKKTP